ncbi:MAG: hypothetical protein IKD31_02520 [Clostridia bacterium]|nr:hypothetical protein [Clostridia bacterium]
MSHSGSDFLPNFVEHIVPLKETRLVLPKKLMLIGFALLLVVLVFIASFSFLQILTALVPVALILVAFVVWYLWRFVSVEFEYTVMQGEISFEAIYGRRQRKKVYSTPLSRVEKFARVENGRVPEADRARAAKEVFCASAMKNPNTWYALVKEENGETTLLLLELTEKAEKTLRFFNNRAFLG